MSSLPVKPRVLALICSFVCTGIYLFLSIHLHCLEHEPGGAIWRVPGEECTEATLHSADWVAVMYCCKNRCIMSMDFEAE